MIHTSDVRVDVLNPRKLPGEYIPCICFSLNEFISFFGLYIYLFKRRVLEENFYVKKISSSGVSLSQRTYMGPIPKEYYYRSQDLEYEFRIYSPVEVARYGLGMITQFNHLKGILETRMMDNIIRREIIDLSD